MSPLRVALVSIGHCPSLALRNIQTYCERHDDVRHSVEFRVYDYDLRGFREAREQSALQWSFLTKFDEVLTEFHQAKPAIVAFSCYL